MHCPSPCGTPASEGTKRRGSSGTPCSLRSRRRRGYRSRRCRRRCARAMGALWVGTIRQCPRYTRRSGARREGWCGSGSRRLHTGSWCRWCQRCCIRTVRARDQTEGMRGCLSMKHGFWGSVRALVEMVDEFILFLEYLLQFWVQFAPSCAVAVFVVVVVFLAVPKHCDVIYAPWARRTVLCSNLTLLTSNLIDSCQQVSAIRERVRFADDRIGRSRRRSGITQTRDTCSCSR